MRRFFWLLLLLLVSCGNSIKEKEGENNTASGAGILKSGQTGTGDFTRNGKPDSDFWKIPAAQPSLLRGTLTGVKGVNSQIRLYRAGESSPFKIIDDYQGSLGESFGPFIVEPPYALAELRSPRGTSENLSPLPYEFSVSLIVPSPPVEREPNDSPEEANLFTGEFVIGYYSNVFVSDAGQSRVDVEKDFYRLELSEAKKYILGIELTGVGGIDPVLRVYNSDGALIRTIDERALGQGENINSFGFPGPGFVYLSVNTKDQKISMGEYYELRVRQSEYQSKYEFEPNDDPGDATPLTEEITEGEISDNLDNDYYIYQNPFEWPVHLNIAVTPDPDLDIVVSAFGKNFQDSGTGLEEGFSAAIVPEGGTIVFSLSSSGGKKGAKKYKISASTEQAVDFFENEPNDSRGNANGLRANTTIAGYINPNSDVDFFLLDIRARERYKLTLDAIDGCLSRVRITDKKGIAYETKSARRAGEGISAGIFIDPGSYLKLDCESSKNNLFRSPYKIILEPEESF